MSTACVEEGDSVLEWGYLLQGCGLTRLLGPSLYLWASFWNCGAKSRTVLKKIWNYWSQKSVRHCKCRKSQKNRTTPKVQNCVLGGHHYTNFCSSARNGVGKREDQEVFVGHALAQSWQKDGDGNHNPHMDDSSHGGTAVPAAELQGVLQGQRAALGLPVPRTCHLGEGHGKAMRHEGKWEPESPSG